MDVIYHTIEALLIIHNILIDLNDNPSSIQHFNGAEDPAVLEWRRQRDGRHGERGEPQEGLSSDDLYRAGLLRRKWLLDLSNR